jgi:hypothetical protein
MKELWRKTANLFLNYPILWLPYVCVHLLNASLDLLRHAAVVWIMRWPTTWRSVLGGAPVQIHSGTAAAKIAWFSGVMEWSIRYLTLFLYAVALVITAALVTMIVRGEQPRLRAALAELRNYPKRILGYSFKLYFLNLVFAAFVSLPALRLSRWVTDSAATTGWSRAANFALTQGQGLVSLILFAWIMTPITIRLLRGPSAEAPSADEKKLGRYFVILAGAGVFALEAALFPLLFNLITLRPSLQHVYASLLSLVLSFPFPLGDIGVALIAAGGEWNVGETSVPRKWRQLVRGLMPLHLDQREGH